MSVPPPIARWILRQLAGSTHGDAMVGDLDEEFHEHVVGERSLFAARMWYRAQVIKSLSPTLLQRARRAGKNRQSGKMGDGMMSTFLNDLRCALRGVRKSPAFASLVILTLALGIGTNTIIYSVVDGLILHPYPFPDADRLIAVGTEYPKLGSDLSFVEHISPPLSTWTYGIRLGPYKTWSRGTWATVRSRSATSARTCLQAAGGVTRSRQSVCRHS